MKNHNQRRKPKTPVLVFLVGTATLGAIVTSTVFFGDGTFYPATLCMPAIAADSPPDYFCGKFENIDGYFPHAKDPRHVEIAKEGNEYRLIGTKVYDQYRFVKTEDGILQDKERHLGKIYMGTTTFKGLDTKMRVLKADFCYNSFLLLPTDGQSRWMVKK